ncbi:hypothetical protein [Aminobacter ciceronei]|uniref:hypothetical protein n=1 Tax=Aminobacter ciceronei TaxID=150723 RepID=UPI003F715E96
MPDSRKSVVPYSPVIRIIFYLEMLAGICIAGSFLWMGEAIIPKTLGGETYRFDRVNDPYFYWAVTTAIFLSLTGLPAWYLKQGGLPRS